MRDDLVITLIEHWQEAPLGYSGPCSVLPTALNNHAGKHLLGFGRTFIYLKYNITPYPLRKSFKSSFPHILRESFKSPVPPILRKSFKSRIPHILRDSFKSSAISHETSRSYGHEISRAY